MASAKVSKEKLRRSGSLKKEKEPPPSIKAPTDDQFKLSDLDILETLGKNLRASGFPSYIQVLHAQERVLLAELCRPDIKRQKDYYALKVMTISEVIRLKQVEHVLSEKNVLAQLQHPFIVTLFWSYHTNTFLYMLLEFVPGGELFSYLRNAGRFNSATSQFYCCEIVCALEYLHSKSIIYRDLKPENLLLDREGHLKITDFGFAKVLKDRTWTLCGTPEYLAPEIIQSKGHNKAVDWWSLGILLYEMLIGYPPFFDDNPFGIYEKILAGKIDWPRHMDPVAKDLIKKLLVLDRTKRLGNMKNGAEDVKKHKYFKSITWEDVKAKKLKPAIKPNILHEGDCGNYAPQDYVMSKYAEHFEDLVRSMDLLK